MNFQLLHLATLFKYAGISFIAGAVNHGFFSEIRSFWTAGIGVALFLIGGLLEVRAHPTQEHNWGNLLGLGIVASIGLGFFTGGLQHFPDSPARSAWVVPLGFAMSLLALYLSEGRQHLRWTRLAPYGLAVGSLVIVGSLMAWDIFQDASNNSFSHNHEPVSTAQAKTSASREIQIEMNDAMRFVPDQFSALPGESIRLIVSNRGQLVHELVIGSTAELLAHAQEMKKSRDHLHPHGNAVSLKPGEKKALVWTFKEQGDYSFACFEPGHFEAGMRGSVRVTKQLGTPPKV